MCITGVDLAFRPNIYANRFRRKRFNLFMRHLIEVVGKDKTLRILDIGGVVAYWEGVRDLWSHLPVEITIVNIGVKESDSHPYFIRPGDGRDLHQYDDNYFDVVHSNSVIEHVGHWPEIQAMAKEIRRIAPHYFVQTPNFGFPVEPHFRTLFFHWYPEAVRAHMLMKKTRGFRTKEPSLDAAMRNIQSVNLLTVNQMRTLFPDGRIQLEKYFGLNKSITAIR